MLPSLVWSSGYILLAGESGGEHDRGVGTLGMERSSGEKAMGGGGGGGLGTMWGGGGQL